MLKMHRDEIDQSLYYTAYLVENVVLLEDEENPNLSLDETLTIDIPQTTLRQMIKFVGIHNIKETWAVSVGNSLKVKHYVLLLQNYGHICSCLSIVRCGVICRHFFQVMLVTKDALFHIRLIPTRWYCTKNNGSEAQFLTADKFMQEEQIITDVYRNSVPYLCLFNQDNKDFREERLTIFEQKIIYGKLHGTYKKALLKALKTNAKSQQLIGLLQEFIIDGSDENEDIEDIDKHSDLEYEFQQDNDNDDKENDPLVPLLQNPKKHRSKGRPPGTKRFKSVHEAPPKTKNQRKCKKCGNIGHYQKNCKVSHS